ncbi:hypothetical protein FOL47_002406 [Perkinsus chesapeaki]|uniref:Uncharacterized protein n=1 Tax=Perkinsus chesapeaki TaxID=330153 RepID=A0A7J6MER8_PERCH|nr:hypothetical protein FOL47_002406 [Perkinsus chesapeaki]
MEGPYVEAMCYFKNDEPSPTVLSSVRCDVNKPFSNSTGYLALVRDADQKGFRIKETFDYWFVEMIFHLNLYCPGRDFKLLDFTYFKVTSEGNVLAVLEESRHLMIKKESIPGTYKSSSDIGDHVANLSNIGYAQL